jgi:hypothetical protein
MFATGTGAMTFSIAAFQPFLQPLTYSVPMQAVPVAHVPAPLPSDARYFVTSISGIARNLTIEEERAISAALFAGARLVSRGRLIRG